MLRFLRACIEGSHIYSTSYTNCDGDKGVNFPSFCSQDSNEWVILIDFLPSCDGGESIMAICEINESDYI